jgi:ABC-2 type transport system permease protein
MRRIIAQARKELTQLVRDKLALAMALGLPTMLLLLMGTTLSLTVTGIPIIIRDFDDSQASRQFIDAFRASVTFKVVGWPIDKKPEEAFLSGKARGVLIIPNHFGHDLARGENTDVQILVDGTDANTAKLTQAYAGQVVNAFVSSTAGATRASPVAADVRLWFNPGRVSKKFYGPGIFVLGLSMFPPLLAALAMAKEGEQKTILQVYVSNVSAHEFLLGKILAFMIVTFGEFVIAMFLMYTYFGLQIVGDPTPLLVATILYAFCVSSFGNMVGAAIPNQAAAIQAVALGGFLLVFLLSGLIFPISNIPEQIRWLSSIVWGRYYIEIVRDALLKGGGWAANWFGVAMIGMIGSVFYWRAWKTLRKMQLSY